MNSDESVKIIKKVLVPYFKSQRKELELDEKFPALFPDAFWGQMVLEVREKKSVCEGTTNGGTPSFG